MKLLSEICHAEEDCRRKRGPKKLIDTQKKKDVQTSIVSKSTEKLKKTNRHIRTVKFK